MSTRPTITPRMAQDAALALGPDLTDEACPYGLSNATPAELHNLVTLARILTDTATSRYGLTEVAIHHTGSTQSRTVAFACPTEPERIAVEIHPHGARVTVYSYDGPDPYILGTEFTEDTNPAAILDLACDLIAYADEVNR